MDTTNAELLTTVVNKPPDLTKQHFRTALEERWTRIMACIVNGRQNLRNISVYCVSHFFPENLPP